MGAWHLTSEPGALPLALVFFIGDLRSTEADIAADVRMISYGPAGALANFKEWASQKEHTFNLPVCLAIHRLVQQDRAPRDSRPLHRRRRFFSGLAGGRHEPNRRIGTFGLAVGAAARNFNCRSPDQPRALLGGGRGHVLRMHRHPHNFLVRKQLEQCEAPHARISQWRVT